MDLYNGVIDEFTDWITGINSFTGQDVTDKKQVSGASIRQLLQDRLKHPFVLKEDIVNNKYRMFSSERAYELWAENPSDNSELELFSFVRPSDYKLTFAGLDNSNKYIRQGDINNIGARIQYSWSIYNDEGESSEGLAVTYTIVNESTGKTNTFTRWYNKGDVVDFSIYNYLKAGKNTITISGRGTESGARNSAYFNIVVLQLNVSSDFKFYDKYTSGSSVRIPCFFERNDDSGSAKVYFVIDSGTNTQEIYTTDVLANSGVKINTEKTVAFNLAPGKHTLQIYSQSSYNDGGTVINSNLLYYTFVIANPEISVEKFIPISTSFDSGVFPFNSLILTAQQYMQQQLSWGYYTDAQQSDSKLTITWKLYKDSEDQNPTVLSTITANTQTKSPDLQYIPEIYSEYDEESQPLTFLSAQYNNVELLRIPIHITRNNDFNVSETGSYVFKLSAFGKTNSSTDNSTWEDSQNGVHVNFTGIQWNANSGWYENSFRTCGTGEYAVANHNPFAGFDINTDGKTIEVEFETEKVVNDNDVLIKIGSESQARIEITPTTATLYNNANEEVIHTNYKSNERLKLAFIINSSNSAGKEANLAYIVNNGILERASYAAGGTYNSLGGIKIGGSASGVRVYNMRIYNYAITYTQAYNNYVFDSNNKVEIYDNNNILGVGDKISYELCKSKIDTFLISGDLSNILNQQAKKEDSVSEVTLERTCPYDSTKNFKINNIQIRKHGQSTLNYPISSMKVWFNKSTSTAIPTFEIAPQDPLPLNKNRYRMKDNSIPSNKFVFQANYADSSGVHNGGLERLIQSSWYNAEIDDQYKLRTEPQLFTSIPSDQKDLYNLDSVWNDYFPNSNFPYELRVSPDSIPCAVFYQNVNDDTQTFLGQYVFMDDKKSDFLYGERSIYKVQQDPFCLTTTHKSDDKSENKIWDNGNVLRIEVVESNNVYSSYMTSDGFDETEYASNEEGSSEKRYKWERAFEMIYPDPDDLAGDVSDGTDKFGDNSKFAKKAKPFVDWFKWVVSTRNNQQKFQDEAADHLDLYKMAAYYIFVLRFGLVDSMERNAQIKTYDGVHFHYEPWDMDIALGNKNDGGIAYNPPIDRNTKLPGSITTYAISGRSADSNGNIVTSNWLWDALEAWPYWANTIVPKTADALHEAGLSYNNVSEMFDENYANAWCETMYNKSGDFKYIQSRGTDNEWLRWLQGARMTHRHWWLSTSMDYYDAKWFCGDYKNHSIYITANVSEGSNAKINIIPNKSTYIVIQKDNKTIHTEQVSPNNPLSYVAPVLNTKNPFHIYGANFMDTVDLSEIAAGLDAVDFTGVYSKVLGSPLKKINIGTKLTEVSTDTYTTVRGSLGGAIRGQKEAFENLQTLNIRGQINQTGTRDFIHDNNISSLKNVYAMGSGLSDFYSSSSGNTFNNVELPSSVSTLYMNDSTWEDLSFWEITSSDGSTSTIQKMQSIPTNLTSVTMNGISCQNANSIEFIKNWIASITAQANVNLSSYAFNADKIRWDNSLGSENMLTYEELEIIAQMNHNLRGYILLKNEDGTPLTTLQLGKIKEWFGDSVFDRNSSGLVVDHELEYTQIIVGGDAYIQDGEIYLNEGGRASLNATTFMLSDEINNQFIWTITTPTDSTKRYQYEGCSIINQDMSGDGFAYLQTRESQVGHNYDVNVHVTIGTQDQYITIHIIAATYPTDFSIQCESLNGKFVRTVGNIIAFVNPSATARIYESTNQNPTATITNTVYTIQNGSNGSIQYDKQSGSIITNDWDNTIDVQINNNGGITASWLSGSFPADNSIIEYTVKIKNIYASGKTIEITKQLIVLNDSTALLDSASHPALYRIFTTKIGSTANNYLYRLDLMSVDGELVIEEQQNENITSILTSKGDSVLNYIPNITNLSIINCTGLQNNNNQFVFTNMIKLQALSLKGCTAISGDIDLTSNTAIKVIDFENTSANVVLPANCGVETIKLGSPTKVVFNNPSVLQPSGVSVQNSTNISHIDVRNISNFKTFAMFDKIIN